MHVHSPESFTSQIIRQTQNVDVNNHSLCSHQIRGRRKQHLGVNAAGIDLHA